MPDIAMCKGETCTLKETCYRFLAKPNEYQTYLINPPIETLPNGDHKCDYYWKITPKEDEDNML